MNKTKRNVKEALFMLSRLVEDESTLHKVIRGGYPGIAQVYDLQPEMPSYFKIECKAGYSSPIIINL